MKEYFVMSDIHSFYTEMRKSLKSKGFKVKNSDHILIVCGDLLDRGPESKETLDFVYKLWKQNRFIFIRGNHEDLFDYLLNKEYPDDYDESNGTIRTIGDLCDPIIDDAFYNLDTAKKKYDKRWDELRNDAVDYYETDNYIFVHGWIACNTAYYESYSYDPNWRNAPKYTWRKVARWINGMDAAEQGVLEPGKTIICGHYHCSYGNVRKYLLTEDMSAWELYRLETECDKKYFKPFHDDGIIAIDACTALTGFCNCLHFYENEL